MVIKHFDYSHIKHSSEESDVKEVCAGERDGDNRKQR